MTNWTTRGLAIAGPVLATAGITVLLAGCADSADHAASNTTPTTPAVDEAAPPLADVTVDVRRDPG